MFEHGPSSLEIVQRSFYRKIKKKLFVKKRTGACQNAVCLSLSKQTMFWCIIKLKHLFSSTKIFYWRISSVKIFLVCSFNTVQAISRGAHGHQSIRLWLPVSFALIRLHSGYFILLLYPGISMFLSRFFSFPSCAVCVRRLHHRRLMSSCGALFMLPVRLP